MKQAKTLTVKTLNKGNVWDLQENDVFRMWTATMKDADMKENLRHFLSIVNTAFDVEEVKIDKPEVIKKYEARGFKVSAIKNDDGSKTKWAVKKHPIMRITDLTYENIHHISAAKLIEVLDRNFGGGWDSLSQSIQDIIESGFDISTTTLPKDRLHKKGGMYEKKVADGYEVLEVAKGTWVEAIFAKMKPESIKPRMKYDDAKDVDDDEDDDTELPIDDYNKPDEDDIELEEPNDDDINENNYRTTFDITTDSDEDAESLSDYIADE
jgi:hypothetical protein